MEELLVILSAWRELLHCLVCYFLDISPHVESFRYLSPSVGVMDDTDFDNLEFLFYIFSFIKGNLVHKDA